MYNFLKTSNLVLFLLCLTVNVKAQYRPFLKSVEPIPNGNPDGVGRLSTALYNGYCIGISYVKCTGKIEMFLQRAGGHGRSTYWYAFSKLTEDGIPIYKKPIKLNLPFDDKGKNRGIVISDKNNKAIFI